MKDTLPPESAAGAPTSASAAPISSAPSHAHVRDLLAARAMAAMISRGGFVVGGPLNDEFRKTLAREAYAFADAMIAARGPAGLDCTPREPTGPILADPGKVTW